MEKYAKLKKRLIITVIVIVALVVSYYIYAFVRHDALIKEAEKVVELDVNDELITSNFNKLQAAKKVNQCGVNITTYFTNKKVTVDDLSNDFVYETVLGNIGDKEEISKKEFHKELLNIFGSNYSYLDTTYFSCPTYKYDDDSNSYKKTNEDCGGVCVYQNEYKIVGGRTEANKLSIDVRVLFLNADQVNGTFDYYSDFELTKKVASFDAASGTKVDDSLIEKGTLYRMTFYKDGKNYIFDSSERVKE